MTETKTNPIFRLMPSLTDIAFILPIIFLFGGLNGVRTMIGDGDTGWHIRSGDWILAHMQVPHQDMFSFTKPGQPWFAWEWLWDVCFAWIHRSWGLTGVVLVSLLVICLTSALLYKLLLRVTAREGQENPLVAIALTALAMGGASIHWLARPHLFTMLFLVIFMMVLEKVRDQEACGKTGQTAFFRWVPSGESTVSSPKKGVSPSFSYKLLWTLPLLTILWTNLHGGFFIGIVLVGAYAVGPLLRAAIEPDGAVRAAYAKSSVKYLVTAAACALASLVNPYTYHLHEHIYNYLRDPFAQNFINEFQPTNFRWAASGFLEIMLILAVATAIWYGRRKQFTEVLLVAVWGHLALVVARNAPIFMLVTAPLVARPVVHWLSAAADAPVAAWLRAVAATLKDMGQEMVPLERPWRAHAISAAALVFIGALMASPQAVGKFRPEYDPARYPAAALAQLREPGLRIFSDYDWGGYLIYALSPQGAKVYVDGRSDFYGDKFGEEFQALMNVKYDWEKTLAGYGVDTILLPADAPLAGAIKESRHWRVSYDDGLALVFRPAEGAPGTSSQVSAGTAGGWGGRDLPVTATTSVHPQEHVFQTTKEGVYP